MHPKSDRRMDARTAEAVAPLLKVVADPTRLRMLSAVVSAPTGEVSAGDLATLTDAPRAAVSHHLTTLRSAGVLTAERRGTWVWYRIAPSLRSPLTLLLDRFATAALTAAAQADDVDDVADVADVEPWRREAPGEPATTLDLLAGSLAGAYPELDRAEVDAIVQDSYAVLAARGGDLTRLIELTERFSRQRIADRLHQQAARPGTTRDTRPRVLFVCVGNAGRSQLAAALLQHHAGDRIVVRSAGSVPVPEIHATIKALLAELPGGEPERVAYPKPLTDDAVQAADVVITMGCGDSCPVLPGKRYEDWPVGEPEEASPAAVRAIRDELDRRVRALAADLLPST
jgi:ArsR family transcriptional regulator